MCFSPLSLTANPLLTSEFGTFSCFPSCQLLCPKPGSGLARASRQQVKCTSFLFFSNRHRVGTRRVISPLLCQPAMHLRLFGPHFSSPPPPSSSFVQVVTPTSALGFMRIFLCPLGGVGGLWVPFRPADLLQRTARYDLLLPEKTSPSQFSLVA